MERIYSDKFLVKSTIPEKKKDDDIYNCVWRAHRDVLTGRFYFKNYLKKSKTIIDDLYKIIKEYKEPLYSEYLIEELTKRYKNVEFGAIQKIVNMSLKYLLILKEYCGFEKNIDESKCDCTLDSIILNKLSIEKHVKDLKETDVEIDTDTLNALKENKIKWTSINKEQYCDVQKIIGFLTKDYGSKLYYDFKNW